MNEKIKRVFAILLSVMLVASLAACSSKEDTKEGNSEGAQTEQGNEQNEEQDEPQEQDNDNSGDAQEASNPSGKTEITLAWADASNDETMQMIHKGIEGTLVPKYEEQYGVKINTLFADSAGDVGQQITDVENFVAQQVDAISCRPVDVDGSAPAFDYATSSGVPILSTWWNVNTENKIGTLVVVDNKYIGKIMTEWLIDYAEKNNTDLKVGLILGRAAAPETNVRGETFKELITEKYGDLTSGQIQVVVEGYGEQNTNTSMQLVEDWMQVHDDLNCIFAVMDDSAYGAIQVLKSTNKLDDFVVIGCNGNTYLNLVGEGEMDMTVIIDQMKGVDKEFDVLCRASLGLEIPDLAASMADYLFPCDASNFDEMWETYGNR